MEGAASDVDRKVILPDYEVTLRANAFRVLREDGVREDRLETEWERLRRAPSAYFETPTLDELENMDLGTESKSNAAE